MRRSDRPSRRSWRTALAGFTVGMTLLGLSAVPAFAANGNDGGDHGCGGTVSAVAQQRDTDTGGPATGGFDNHGGFVSDTARDCAAQQGSNGGVMQNSDEDQQSQPQAQQSTTKTTDDDQMVPSSGGTMQNTDEDQDTNKMTDRDTNTGNDSNRDKDTNQGGGNGSQGGNHGQSDRDDGGKSKH